MLTTHVDENTRTQPKRPIWLGVLGVWFLILCIVPDRRPLGANEWLVDLVRSIVGVREPVARLLATLGLFTGGLFLLGLLTTVATGARAFDRRGLAAFVLAPLLGGASLWINTGYFPIDLEIWITAAATVLGVLGGLAIGRSRVAAVLLVVLPVGMFLWGTATEISDEMYDAAGAVADHVFEIANEIPDGDAGFCSLMERAFAFADANSRPRQAVGANKAVILALGAILGHQRIADVARRQFDPAQLPKAVALRRRITAYGRRDWPRHFWVSAALTTLSDRDRSIAVGLTKELMDATPGGTGFSFSDLAADAAGNRFSLLARRDVEAALALRQRIAAGVQTSDVLPQLRDLPEGITQDAFQKDYGGLGGKRTGEVVDEIRSRLARCRLLR